METDFSGMLMLLKVLYNTCHIHTLMAEATRLAESSCSKDTAAKFTVLIDVTVFECFVKPMYGRCLPHSCS